MNNDRILVTSEKKYTFNGIFNIKETYEHLKEYLENSRHYEISEKDYEEKLDEGKKKIVSKNEAEVEFNDYYKKILKYELSMEGKDVEVKINEKKTLKLTKGKATIIINCYIEPDFDSKRPQYVLEKFLDRVYTYFFRKNELEKCIISASSDIGGLLARFKEEMNSVLK